MPVAPLLSLLRGDKSLELGFGSGEFRLVSLVEGEGFGE
jgi:hypothetical protein